jgi:DNA-directed RNA polymerase sigma subunit (sigma70/sigma32)
MTETCALDVADRGGITLEEVGEIMNLTRERVRQVETAGLAKLQAIRDISRLKDYVL